MARQKGNQEYSPRQWAALAIMVAMAMVLSFVEFPLFPSAEFLKYDPSSIIAILASLLFGPLMGCAVAVLAWAPRLVNDPLGAFMNIMSVLPVIIAVGWAYQRTPSRTSAIAGAIVGSVLAIVVSVALNYLVMPVFYEVPVQSVTDMLAPVLIPFNIAKVVLNSVVSLVTYQKFEKLLAEDDDPVAESRRSS